LGWYPSPEVCGSDTGLVLLIFWELLRGCQGLRIPCISWYPSASSSKRPLSNTGNPHGRMKCAFLARQALRSCGMS